MIGIAIAISIIIAISVFSVVMLLIEGFDIYCVNN